MVQLIKDEIFCVLLALQCSGYICLRKIKAVVKRFVHLGSEVHPRQAVQKKNGKEMESVEKES